MRKEEGEEEGAGLEWRMAGWTGCWLHWREWREQERSGLWGGGECVSVRGECGRGGLRSVEEGAHWKEGVCEWGGLTSVTSDPWEGGEECE